MNTNAVKIYVFLNHFVQIVIKNNSELLKQTLPVFTKQHIRRNNVNKTIHRTLLLNCDFSIVQYSLILQKLHTMSLWYKSLSVYNNQKCSTISWPSNGVRYRADVSWLQGKCTRVAGNVAARLRIRAIIPLTLHRPHWYCRPLSNTWTLLING